MYKEQVNNNSCYWEIACSSDLQAKLEHPSLEPLLRPVTRLEDVVRGRAMNHLRRDGLLMAEEVTDRQSPYFNDRDKFALDRYKFSICLDCRKVLTLLEL